MSRRAGATRSACSCSRRSSGSEHAQGQLRALGAGRGASPPARRIGGGSPRAVDLRTWLRGAGRRNAARSPARAQLRGARDRSRLRLAQGRAHGRLRRALIYDPAQGGTVADHMRSNSIVGFDLADRRPRAGRVCSIAWRPRAACPCSTPRGPTILHYAVGEQITNHFDFLNPGIEDYETPDRAARRADHHVPALFERRLRRRRDGFPAHRRAPQRPSARRIVLHERFAERQTRRSEWCTRACRRRAARNGSSRNSSGAAWRSTRARRTWADRNVRFDFTDIKIRALRSCNGSTADTSNDEIPSLIPKRDADSRRDELPERQRARYRGAIESLFCNRTCFVAEAVEIAISLERTSRGKTMLTAKLGTSNRQQLTVLASTISTLMAAQAMKAQAQESDRGNPRHRLAHRAARPRRLEPDRHGRRAAARELEHDQHRERAEPDAAVRARGHAVRFRSAIVRRGDARYREREPARHRPEPHPRARGRPPRAAGERFARRRLEHDSRRPRSSASRRSRAALPPCTAPTLSRAS